jgi:hypothetical protein|tara:strand:+ start:239 stop:412 length:174 start_codon:yes stop_codon:yes gene_type:complete
MTEVTENHIIQLLLESFFVLVIGIVLWRIMARISRKNTQTKRSTFFDSKFKDKWKRK